MKASQRALILATVTEIIGLVLSALACVVPLPLFLRGAILGFHFPAMYAIDRLDLPLGDVQRWIVIGLLQWLFWILTLSFSFAFVGIYGRRRERHG